MADGHVFNKRISSWIVVLHKEHILILYAEKRCKMAPLKNMTQEYFDWICYLESSSSSSSYAAEEGGVHCFMMPSGLLIAIQQESYDAFSRQKLIG